MGNDFRATYNDDWDADEPAQHRAEATSSFEPRLAPIQAPRSLAVPSRLSPTAPKPATSTPTISRPVPHKKNPKNFPGFIARSAMFRVSNTDEYFAQPTLVRAQGCTLMMSGPKLGMRDKHVWETAIQVAKERAPNIGEAFEIELRDFATRMGSKNHGGRALTAIWESLERLARCRVEFEIGNSCKGIGALLATAFRESGHIYLRLNPDFIIPALLGDKQFVFDQIRRRTLPFALSQWLHDFFSTHKQAREMDLLYLRELCGYDGSPRNFPGRLRSAMETLINAAPGLVGSFEIEETGRCSNGWKLRVVLGHEKPSFLQAERIPVKHKSGRGKVAL